MPILECCFRTLALGLALVSLVFGSFEGVLVMGGEGMVIGVACGRE